MTAQPLQENPIMKRIKLFLGYNWAMPVVSRPWAIVASITEIIKRASGYRVMAVTHHRAWERAVGVS